MFVTDYRFVSQQPATSLLSDVTYQASLVNLGGVQGTVTAVVSSLDPSRVRVLSGQDTLTFFAVPANSKTASTGAFTILVNTAQPLDFSNLQWTFQTTPAPPVANPGPNQIVTVGSTVTLDGSGSTNPNGIGALDYHWQFILRAPGSLITQFYTTSVKPTFVANAPGDYVITLTVSNGIASSSADVTVTAIPQPTPE
jgi:hypothetical protein